MQSDESKEPRVRVVDRRWWARGESADTGEDAGARKPTYVEELEKQIEEHKERLQEFMNEHRRSLDEFEQVKLRIRRDVAREVERGRRAVLVELLEVLDNLDRAVAAARDPAAQGAADGASQLLRGVELVRDQFLAKLESFGVRLLAVARGRIRRDAPRRRHDAAGFRRLAGWHRGGGNQGRLRDRRRRAPPGFRRRRKARKRVVNAGRRRRTPEHPTRGPTTLR